MGVEISFDGYLRSVVSTYQQWWRLYTLTDATGRESQRVERGDRIAPAFFDFGLMVQTVDKEKVESQKEKEEGEKEKIERLPVLEGICKYAAEHVLLVGRPGSGKSTALARLLLQEAENALSDRLAKIPVLVELRYLSSDANERSVIKHIRDFGFRKHDPALNLDDETIENLLFQGRLLLLVDGVNDCAVQWLEDLLKHHLIQISNDRIEFRHQLIQEYYAAEWLLGLLPSLSDARLRQFYLNYLKWTEPLALMLELVEGEEQAVRVVRLSLDVDLRLGARLAGAVKYKFQEKTLGMLIREIDEQKTPKLYAIELFGETKSNNAIKRLNQAFENENHKIDEFHLEIYTRNKTLHKAKRVTLLGRVEIDKKSLAKQMIQALGKINSNEAIESLIKVLECDVSGAAEALGRIGSDKAVEPLIEALNRQYFLNSNVAEALAKIGSDKAVEYLIQALKVEDFDVRTRALEALNMLNNEKAIESLIQILNDKDSDMRIIALYALGKLHSDKAVPHLIQALNHECSDVRERAAYSLGEIGSDKAVPHLIQALNHECSNVYESIVEALGKIGSDRAIDPLIQSLNHENVNARRSVIEALGKIGNHKAIDPLIQSLKDRDANIRGSVAEALGKIGSDKAIDPLVLTFKDKDYNVREKVVESLGKIGSHRVIEPLIQSLKDKSNGVRERAVESLGKIDNYKVIEPLIQSLKDKSNDVREKTKLVLVKIGGSKVIERLIQVLEYGDSKTLKLAVYVLGELGSDRAIEPLIQVLKHKDSDVLESVVYALGKIKIGSDKAVEPLIQVLEHENSDVLKSVVYALGKIGCDKAVEPLVQILKHEDSEVFERAVYSLGEIGSKKAVEPLIQYIKNSDPYLRKHIAEALKKMTRSDAPNLSILTQQLPHLRTLIPTEASQEALSVITAIQDQCKYYNYDIDRIILPPEDKPISPTGITYIFKDKVGQVFGGDPTFNRDNTGTQNNFNQLPSKQTMTQPNFNFHAPVGQVIAGDQTVTGDNIGTQNNYYGTDDPNTQELANELVEILQGIVPKISDPTSEAGKEIITAAAMEEIENKPTLKDRLVAAFKAGAFEAIKKIAKNDFVEVFLTAFKAGLEAKPKK